MMLACRLPGHRPRYASEGYTPVWTCDRDAVPEDPRRHEMALYAARYARAFDREDREDLGRRAPPIGLVPLRLLWGFRNRRGSGQESNCGGGQRR